MSQQNIDLVSGTQTATGQSAWVPIPTVTMADLGIDITAKSGTSPTLDIWLQYTPDGGNTIFDVPYDQQLTKNAAGADLTANTNKRNINGTSSATAEGSHMASYKHLPPGQVRLAWVIGGTAGPSFTFTGKMAAK